MVGVVGLFIPAVGALGDVLDIVGAFARKDAAGVVSSVATAAIGLIPGAKFLAKAADAVKSSKLGKVAGKILGATRKTDGIGTTLKNAGKAVAEQATKAKEGLSGLWNKFKTKIGKGKNTGNPVIDNMRNRVPNKEVTPPNKRGNAPISNKDGKPIEIHHKDQEPLGPFDEMHPSDHRYGKNYKKNHPNYSAKSKVDRAQFREWKREYWEHEWDNGRWNK